MKTPAQAAMPYYQQIPGVGQTYYGPYVQQGQQANQLLESGFGSMFSDPSGFVNKLMGGYSTSPWAQNEEDITGRKVDASAAAGGYAGTPYNAALTANAESGIAGKDMNDWLNHVLGVMKMGAGGETMLSNQGFSAARSLTDLLTQNLAQEGNLAFSSQAQENQWTEDRKRNQRRGWSDLFGSAGSFLDDMNLFHQSRGPGGSSGTGGMFGDLGMIGSSALMF